MGKVLMQVAFVTRFHSAVNRRHVSHEGVLVVVQFYAKTVVL